MRTHLWTWNCSDTAMGRRQCLLLLKLRGKHCRKQKQFQVQCSVHKFYKTRKWTLLCIRNFEENMDLSRIYVAVILKIFWTNHGWICLVIFFNFLRIPFLQISFFTESIKKWNTKIALSSSVKDLEKFWSYHKPYFKWVVRNTTLL